MSFSCITITPIDMLHCGLAIATQKAGGWAVLDLEFCQDLDKAFCNFKNTLPYLKDAKIGFRFHLSQLKEIDRYLKTLSGYRHFLIVCGYGNIIFEGEEVWREIYSVEQYEPLDQKLFHAIVLKGNECGGYVGDNSTFVLFQKLKNEKFPIYIEGSGLYTAAGCKAMGASGIILREQLLLMEESPLSEEDRFALRNSKNETFLLERKHPSCRIFIPPNYQEKKELVELYKKKSCRAS